MFNPDEPRRKVPSSNHLKTVFGSNSHNNLISTLDKKRSEISKEKVKNYQMPQHIEGMDPKGSAVINFRQIKVNQNSQIPQKANKEYFQSKLSKKNSIPQPQNGIQINVNIQNILSNRKFNLVEAHSQRSLSRQKKQEEKKIKKGGKTTKVTANNPCSSDFQCDEQLQIKIEKRTEKKILPIQKAAVSSEKLPQMIKLKSNDHNDFQKDLKQFQSKQQQLNYLAQAQAICFLDSRQICYSIDPLYIQKKQKHLNWTMRAILMDWMMHISYQFRLKRETLHIALTLVDNFFQTTSSMSKADFQLTGAAALFIAAKLQEFEPLSSKEFAKSTKERYSAQQIKQMEVKICKALKYNLNPPTINMWANKIMQQWDLFLDNTSMLRQPFFEGHQPKYFKKIDEDSYKNYRQMMQILDCAILDIQTVQYKPKILVISLLYLILGKQFNEFNKKKVMSQFPRTSIFLLEETSFNNMFGYFMDQTFGLKMFEILPSVQYLATYFILPLNYDRPCLRPQDESVENMHLQEYCSYQTYNPNMLAAIKKRFRGIYQ